jgi:hypothetical protein
MYVLLPLAWGLAMEYFFRRIRRGRGPIDNGGESAK